MTPSSHWLRSHRRAKLLLALLLPIVCTNSLAISECRAEGGAAVAFVEQLRSRNLFTLAERQCLDMLASDLLSNEERVLMTIQLAKTFVVHARYRLDGEAADLFQRAKSALNDLALENRLPQAAWRIDLERSQVLSLEARNQLRAARDQPFDKTAQTAAIELATSIEGRLLEQRDRWQNGGDDEEAPDLSSELQWTRQNRTAAIVTLSLEWAELRLAHLQTLSQNSNAENGDPANASQQNAARTNEELQGLVKMLGELQSDASTEQKWDTALLLMEIHQQAGHDDQVDKLLDRLRDVDWPTDYRNRRAVIHVKNLMAQNAFADAAQFLIEYRQQHGPLRDELGYLKLTSIVGLWRIARKHQDEELSGQLWFQVAGQADRAKQQSTPYWGLQAEREWQFQSDVAAYGQTIAIARRRAQGLHAASRFDESVAAYELLASAANASGFADLTAQALHIQASLLYQQQQYAAALVPLARIETEFASQPRLPETQMLQLYCLAQLYDADRSADRLQAYRDRLLQYRTQFAADENRAEATWLLSQLELSQQNRQPAAELLWELIDHPLYRLRARLAFLDYLAANTVADNTQQTGRESTITIDGKRWQPIDVLKRLAADILKTETAETITTADQTTAKQTTTARPLTDDEQQLALEIASRVIDLSEPDYEWAGRLANEVMVSIEQAPNKLPANNQNLNTESDTTESLNNRRSTAQRIEIMSLAGQQQYRDAEKGIEQLAQIDPRQALDALLGITRLVERASATTRPELIRLQLQAARRIDRERQQLSANERQTFDRTLAGAYESTGQTERALTVYRRLVDQSPDDLELAERLGTMLLACERDACLTEALTRWIDIERQTTKGTSAWTDARYNVIVCHYRLGNFAEAGRMLRITSLLYPSAVDGENKPRFTKLRQQIDAALSNASSQNK